jgi:CheY-like chemotaxis protein
LNSFIEAATTESNADKLADASIATPAWMQQLRVLIAEDNKVNMMLLRQILKNLQVGEIIEAQNGAEAVNLFKTSKPNLIFMDVQMPEVDGFEATLRIRKMEDEQEGKVPIVALTANAMKGDRERCLEVGMNDYISKPFLKEQIEKMLFQYANKSNV